MKYPLKTNKANIMLRSFLVVSTLLCLSGCGSVTFRPQESRRLGTYPDVELKRNYYLFGAIGRHEIDAQTLCREKRTRQVQTLFTSRDQLYSVITLGIYTPRTVKIWCY